MGKEYHTLGAHVPLSICIGPMGRSVYGGRNWETFSPDPYLTGEAARLSVQGFQEQGVVGLVKCVLGSSCYRFESSLTCLSPLTGTLSA